MKLLKKGNYNNGKELFEQYKKRIIAGIMALVMPVTVAGCAKEDNEEINSVNEQTTIVSYDDTYDQDSVYQDIIEDNNLDYEETTTYKNSDSLNTSDTKEQTVKEEKKDSIDTKNIEEATKKVEGATKITKQQNVQTKNKSADKVKNVNTNVFFGDRKAYYEYNNKELKSIIDNIKDDNYTNGFKVEKYIKEELDGIKKLGYLNNSKTTYSTNYSWYKNGKIDEDALYNKILKNNLKKGITNNSTVKKLAKYTANAINLDYQYLKKNYPKFDDNFMLHTVDSITAGKIDYEQNVSSFDVSTCFVGYNLDNIYSDHDLLQAACHEIFHMTFSKNIINNTYPIYDEALSLDLLTNANSSLSLEFIGESNIDAMAYSAMGENEIIDYKEEFEKLQMISYSTGKSLDEIRKVFVYGDINGLINLFEPEMQDFTKVYSILAYANAACGYGVYQGVNCNDEFRKDCFEKFRQLLLQNFYIRQAKDYFYGDITFDEMNFQIDLFLNVCESPNFDYGTNNKIFDNYNETYQKNANLYQNGKIR